MQDFILKLIVKYAWKLAYDAKKYYDVYHKQIKRTESTIQQE